MAEHTLDAMAMARAVLSDPQFAFPVRPRVVPGLVTVPSPSGFIVDGGPARQAFQGASARHLPRVMDLLDGNRSVDDVADAAGLRREDVWPILSLLYSTGLLEEADDAGDEADDSDPRTTFLSRSIDTTRVNRNGREAVSRLRDAVVAIVSSEATWATQIARLLRGESVGTVRVVADLDPDGPTPDLVIVVGDDTLAEEAALAGRPTDAVLPVHLDGTSLHVGPLLDSSHTACASCAFGQRRALLGSSGPPVPPGPPASAAAEQSLAALLVVRDVVALLSRVGTTGASRFVVTTRLADLVQSTAVVVPRPSCPVCMDPGVGEDSLAVPLAWAYSHAVAFPPRTTLNPKDHQVHYQSGNIALQRRHRVWPASPLTRIPSLTETADPAASTVRLDVLGDVLVRTVGLRNGASHTDSRVDRWCATGGNLGSPTAYLIARRVDGLAAGVYGFQRDDASLARLTWADAATPIAGAEDWPAVVVLTGALDTVATKYGPFSWRILHLDAGAAVAQAQALTAAAGLRLVPVPVWDDGALAELLGADADAEPVTVVLGITTEGARS